MLILSLLSGYAVQGHAESQRFDDVVLRVGVVKASVISGPAKVHAKTWKEKSGGSVEFVEFPFGELFNQLYKGLTNEQQGFDIILYAPAWTADFAPFLSPLPETLQDNESFLDILPVYRERLMKWNDQWLAVTVDGDVFSGYYRKDLFEDVKNQLSFRKRYGYELAPPDTWAQYRDIAEFFNKRGGSSSSELYGTVEAFARGGQQFWNLFSRVSAYANHPKKPGAQFFDPHTMQAQINQAPWLRAVTEYKNIISFSHPDALTFGIFDARKQFIQGKAAMILDWGDTALLAEDPSISNVAGQVGYFVLPGSNEVWDYVSRQWEQRYRPHKAPFLAFGGWVASIPDSSRYKDAAMDYILWYGSPENSLNDVVTSGTGINPYRYTHFSQLDTWGERISRRAASEYLSVLKYSLGSPNAALDLRLPGFHKYTEALEIELEKIFKDEKSVQMALNSVASQWEAITESYGRYEQLLHYRASMDLPALIHSKKDKYTIGFSQATTTEPWRLQFNKKLREEAAKYSNIELIVADGKDDANKQANDIHRFIEHNVDGLLISPKVSESLTPVVNKAFAKGIPVVVLDRDLTHDSYNQFIGGDNRVIGRTAGEYAIELLGGKGKARGTIVELWGGMASIPAQDRNKGFLEAIRTEPGIKQAIEPTDGDWKQDQAYEIMANALTTIPQVDLVYAHNDPMAFGAYLAAKDVGREKDMFFLGIDAIPGEGVKWVNKGILTATFLYATPGEEGIQQMMRILMGAPYVKRITLPTATVDKFNVSDVLNTYGLK